MLKVVSVQKKRGRFLSKYNGAQIIIILTYGNHFVAQSHTKQITKMSAVLCLKQNPYNREGWLTRAHQHPIFYLTGEKQF